MTEARRPPPLRPTPRRTTLPDARPGPSAAAPPAGPAAAIVAALTAAPGATAAQVARAAGITGAAAARELATLEKAGYATRDRDASPATWTALDAPDEAPGPDSRDSLAPSPGPSGAAGDTSASDADTIGTGDPDPEQEDAEPAVTQAAARTRGLLRDAGRGAAAGTPPGGLRGLVAAHLGAYPAQDFGPHAIGRVLGRSSGAVANDLDRLTTLGQAQLTGEAPRRYRYDDPPAATS